MKRNSDLGEQAQRLSNGQGHIYLRFFVPMSIRWSSRRQGNAYRSFVSTPCSTRSTSTHPAKKSREARVAAGLGYYEGTSHDMARQGGGARAVPLVLVGVAA